MTKDNRQRRIAVLHICVIAAAAALYISAALHDKLWFDEAYTVMAIKNSLPKMIVGLCGDVHPHLYYVLLKIYSYVFGDNIISLRIFSAVFAAATAALGYTHIRVDFGEKVGLWFSVFTALSPMIMVYAEQIRMYSLGIFLLALCGIYAFRYAKSGRKKDRIMFIVFSVLASYTHYFAFFTAAAINVILFAKTVVPVIKTDKRPLFRWLIDGLIQFALYAPGLAVFLHQASLNGANWIKIFFPFTLYATMVQVFVGIPAYSEYIPDGSALYHFCGIAATAAVVLFAVLLVKKYREDRDRFSPAISSAGVCLLVLIFSLAVSVFRPIYYQRYAVMFAPFLAFSGAMLCESFGKSKKSVRCALCTAAVVITAASTAGTFALLRFEISDECTDDISKAIKAESGDIFLADNCEIITVWAYYPENEVVCWDIFGWDMDNPFAAFDDKMHVVDDYSQYEDITGRIWAMGDDTFEWLESFEGTVLLDEVEVNSAYHKRNWKFRLYEKTGAERLPEK